MFDKNKGLLTLEIELTGKQFKFCGDNYQLYIRCVSNSVAKFVPFYYPSWKDVPAKFKNKVYLEVHVSIQYNVLFLFKSYNF